MASLHEAPRTEPTTLVERSWAGLSFGYYREDIRGGVEWNVHDERDTLILHLDGKMDSLESELEGRGSIRGGAIAGEVWSVPRGRRYATAAKGRIVSYGVLRFDSILLGEQGGLDGALGRFDPFLLHAIRQLIAMSQSREDVARLGSEHLAQAIRFHVALNFHHQRTDVADLPRRKSEMPPASIKRLRDYIFDNLSGLLALSQLADVAGMSEHQLLEGFRQAFGTSPHQYIIEQRLRSARSLLARTSLTITQVAFKTGFSSHSHLTRTFQQRIGVSPSEFRRSVA